MNLTICPGLHSYNLVKDTGYGCKLKVAYHASTPDWTQTHIMGYMRATAFHPKVDLVNSRFRPIRWTYSGSKQVTTFQTGVNPQKYWLVRNLAIDRPRMMVRSRFLIMKLYLHMKTCVRMPSIYFYVIHTSLVHSSNTCSFEDPGILQVAHARMVSTYATRHNITRQFVEARHICFCTIYPKRMR